MRVLRFCFFRKERRRTEKIRTWTSIRAPFVSILQAWRALHRSRRAASQILINWDLNGKKKVKRTDIVGTPEWKADAACLYEQKNIIGLAQAVVIFFQPAWGLFLDATYMVCRWPSIFDVLKLSNFQCLLSCHLFNILRCSSVPYSCHQSQDCTS